MMQGSLWVLIAQGLVPDTDTSGVFGGIFHYALIFALVGSAFLSFIYFWSKGRLDLDEEPKMQMMREDQTEEQSEERRGTK